MESRNVIFAFFQLTWAAAQRRGMFWAQDRLVSRLLADERVDHLLLVNAPRSAPVWLAKGQLLGYERGAPPPPARLWQPLRLSRRDPYRVGRLERALRRYDRRLAAVARRYGMHRPAIITTDPFVAGFAPLDWAGPVTLYATDDMAEHPAYTRKADAYREAYARVGASGRAVCAVSPALLDRIGPVGPSAITPNGIEPAEWLDPGPPPGWLQRLPHPRFLYVGTLDDRVDVEAVCAVARANPAGSVCLVGPGAGSELTDRLAAEPNVHVRGPVGRDELPALVRGADVGLLPHVRNRLTEAMSPLKLYEYLAAGLPVAAIDLPPARGVSDRVALAHTTRDLAAAAQSALKFGHAAEAERLGFVSANSWAARHETILGMALRARLDGSPTHFGASTQVVHAV